jgi:hypothetical protein
MAVPLALQSSDAFSCPGGVLKGIAVKWVQCEKLMARRLGDDSAPVAEGGRNM